MESLIPAGNNALWGYGTYDPDILDEAMGSLISVPETMPFDEVEPTIPISKTVAPKEEMEPLILVPVRSCGSWGWASGQEDNMVATEEYADQRGDVGPRAEGPLLEESTAPEAKVNIPSSNLEITTLTVPCSSNHCQSLTHLWRQLSHHIYLLLHKVVIARNGYVSSLYIIHWIQMLLNLFWWSCTGFMSSDDQLQWM